MEMLRYRGRVVTKQDVATINKLIADNPECSRRALSNKLCELWGWYQANGAPRDMVCRGLMLALHRAGHITLPPVRFVANNPLASKQKARRVAAANISHEPIECSLRELGTIEIRQVRRTPDEALFNGLLEAYHYLGYSHPVGENLKFMAFSGQTPLACFAWSSSPRHLRPRDRFIGWSVQVCRANIHYVAYNPRYLILPWVRVSHLASHLLGKMMRMLSMEWQRLYHHPIYLAHTFIDKDRFAGTCYYAANWIWVGRTTGRGKDNKTHIPTRSIKDVLVYPLHKRFRQLLCESNVSSTP
jgi:hypothetical protein